MNTVSNKIRFIVIPYFLLLVTFIGIYCCLDWFLFVRSNNFEVNEKYINVYIPAAFSFLPTFLIIKRIKLLNLNASNGSWLYFIWVIVWVSFLMPALGSNSFLGSYGGKLTTLDSITQINTSANTKFYKVNHFFVDKDQATSYTTPQWLSSRANSSLYYSVFYAIPLLNSSADTSMHVCRAFLGIRYESEKIDQENFPKLNENERNKLWDKFLAHSDSDFKQRNFSTFVYLEKLGVTDDHSNYSKAANSSIFSNGAEQPILIPNNTMFEDRNKASGYTWYLLFFCLSFIVNLSLIFSLKFDEYNLKEFKSSK